MTIKSITERFKKWKKTYFGTKTQLFFKLLGVFFFLFLVIIVQGITKKSANAFTETNLYQEQPVSGGSLVVVKKEYYTDSRIYRVDLYLAKENATIDSTEAKMNATAVLKNDSESVFSSQVTAINDHYYVVLVRDVSDDFAAIRMDITYTLSANDQQDFQVYCSDEKTNTSKKVLTANPEKDFAIDSIQNDIRVNTNGIKELTVAIADKQNEITKKENRITQVTDEKEYQVGDDLETSEQLIVSLTNENYVLEEQISDLKKEIDLTKEKNNLLQEKIDSYLE